MQEIQKVYVFAVSVFLVFVTLDMLGNSCHVKASMCFGGGLNEEPGQCDGGLAGLRCPFYRNLLPHHPMEDNSCPISDIYFRKYGNCVSDKDCCVGSYCCFSICQGVTRCYNPYLNKFTDDLHNFTGTAPCPLTHSPCQMPESELTTTTPTTTTLRPTTTTTTTRRPTTRTTLKPTTTTTERTTTTTTRPTTTTTTRPTTTTTTTPTTTTTTTANPRGYEYSGEELPVASHGAKFVAENING